MISIGPAYPPRVAERAPCVLEDLAATTRSRARLGVLHELDGVAYIEKRPGGHHPVTTFQPAATLPAHPTALGRALLAFSPPAIVEMTILQGLRPYTRHTITSPERFRRALGVTRLTQVAITCRELDAGESTVAIPVFGYDGAIVAAIELTLGNVRRDVASLIPVLMMATRSLSRELASDSAQPEATRTAPANALPIADLPAHSTT